MKRNYVRQIFQGVTLVAMAFALVTPTAIAAEPIKIANIEALSGPFEQFGNQARVGRVFPRRSFLQGRQAPYSMDIENARWVQTNH